MGTDLTQEVENLEIKKLTAKICLSASISTAYLVKANSPIPLDLITVGECITNSAQNIGAGNISEIETILYCQVIGLNAMFNQLAGTATQLDMPYKKDYMNLALKAQNQSRATAVAIINSKRQPSQATFIKQANISSGNQQVNNGQISPEKKLSKEKSISGDQISPSKLLEDQCHGSTHLDCRAKRTTKTSNQEVEAVGALHRPKDA